MKEHISDTILIGKQAHIYLSVIMSSQRGCKPLSNEKYDLQWSRITKYKDTDKRLVDDYTYGGGDGTYNGRWWGWSVDTVKSMLVKAGYDYDDCDSIKFINV